MTQAHSFGEGDTIWRLYFERFRTDKMPSLSSQTENVCEYILNVWLKCYSTVCLTYFACFEQMRAFQIWCRMLDKHGTHMILRHLIVILLSHACLLTHCKSIFNYLFSAQNPKYDVHCTVDTKRTWWVLECNVLWFTVCNTATPNCVFVIARIQA